MENYRKFISDFSSRKMWASTRKLLYVYPPQLPACESIYLCILFLLGLQGSSEQTFLFTFTIAQNLRVDIL